MITKKPILVIHAVPYGHYFIAGGLKNSINVARQEVFLRHSGPRFAGGGGGLRLITDLHTLRYAVITQGEIKSGSTEGTRGYFGT
jgi:hypothetical protein